MVSEEPPDFYTLLLGMLSTILRGVKILNFIVKNLKIAKRDFQGSTISVNEFSRQFGLLSDPYLLVGKEYRALKWEQGTW